MRIITWNCCRSPFAEKLAAAEPLHADILVLQEASRPITDLNPDEAIWFELTPRMGVAVITTNGYHLRPNTDVSGFVACHAVDITGPHTFSLVAVRTHAEHKYIRGLAADLELARDWIRSRDVVLAGDFNSNAYWDSDRKPIDHGRVVAGLQREYGLVSAYHAVRGIPHGNEPDPTHYWQWREDQPYHLDYCFVPERWIGPGTRAEVGNFADWCDLSDHRPLIVDVEPA